MKFLHEVGEYVMIILQAFKRPDKGKVFRRQLFIDFQNMGATSIGVVSIISIFFGAIIAIQTAANIDNPMIPLTTIGFGVRQMMVLEFGPTIISLILVGKIGSSIASEIGTMRVSEQIDALKVMGINPANYLILPKITAAMLYNPVLIVFAIVLGIAGGWAAAVFTGLVTSAVFIEGIRSWYDPFTVTYAFVKTEVFAFIIASVSAYKGYTVKGGSVEVGLASTSAVVICTILIVVFDLIITQMMLI